MSAVLRFLRMLVVVAAGVGAWFGYDAFVEAQDESDVTDVTEDAGTGVGATAPWADIGLVVADTTRPGPTFATVQLAGDIEHHAMTFDPDSGRTQLSLFDQFGQPVGVAELDANEVFIEAADGTWQAPAADGDLTESVLRARAAAAMPPTLVELVPEMIWPWVEVTGGATATPTQRLTVRIFGDAFDTAEPALAATWRSDVGSIGRVGRVELEVEIDSAGHVIALRHLPPGNDVQFRFGPAPVAPTFRAPFVD